MEVIDTANNTVTTECGHKFHTKCLMANVAHNGFSCPYCRYIMAAAAINDDNDLLTSGLDRLTGRWINDEENDRDDLDTTYNNYALRGLRFFYNNLDGIQHCEHDIDDEEETEREIIDRLPKPTPIFIAEKLIEQNVTVEELVKCLLLEHTCYDDQDEEFTRIDESMFEKIETIIRNYRPENI